MKLAFAIIIAVAVCLLATSVWFRTNRNAKQSPVEEVPRQDISERSVPNPTALKRTGPSAIYPDPTKTGGATNPEITQDNVGSTICNPDWSTKSIRPPASYTGRLKREQIRDWNLADTDPKDYEEDHLIPLELGGHPSDPRNLWPEPYDPKPGAREKDRVENQLHKEVCAGDIALDRAQKIIIADWYACYLEVENHELCK